MSLTKEQIENLIEENNQKLRAELLRMASDAKPRTGMVNCVSEWNVDDTYYALDCSGKIVKQMYGNCEPDKKIINQGNAAWDKATLERQAKLNELNTKARAASAKAGVVDYEDFDQSKFYAYWDFRSQTWSFESLRSTANQGCIGFPTKESLTNFMQSLTPDEQRLFAGGDV